MANSANWGNIFHIFSEKNICIPEKLRRNVIQFLTCCLFNSGNEYMMGLESQHQVSQFAMMLQHSKGVKMSIGENFTMSSCAICDIAET